VCNRYNDLFFFASKPERRLQRDARPENEHYRTMHQILYIVNANGKGLAKAREKPHESAPAYSTTTSIAITYDQINDHLPSSLWTHAYAPLSFFRSIALTTTPSRPAPCAFMNAPIAGLNWSAAYLFFPRNSSTNLSVSSAVAFFGR